MEGDYPVDTTGVYSFADGRELAFDGAVELSEQLAQESAVHACYTSQLAELVFGRAVQDGDSPLVFRASEASLNDGLSLKGLALELIMSRIFRSRLPAEAELEESEEGR